MVGVLFNKSVTCAGRRFLKALRELGSTGYVFKRGAFGGADTCLKWGVLGRADMCLIGCRIRPTGRYKCL